MHIDKTVLLVDDDVELCSLLSEYLAAEDFAVTCVHDGESAIRAVFEHDYDLMILDVMMPRLNGLEVLKRLQQTNSMPVLMLTARGDDIDRILGLEMGADDYLPKPCNPRELVARMRAILRRTQPSAENRAMMVIDDLSMDRQSRTVTVNGQIIELTSTEFNMLDCLIQQAGKIVSKETLSEQALFRKLTVYDRSVDMHVSNLRKKLGAHADGGQRIKTIRGQGYLYAPVRTG